jgi:hypothetical protein
VTVDARGIKATFGGDGVYLARGVFDAATIDRLEADFDRIVAQLIESRESIDATWTTADRSTDRCCHRAGTWRCVGASSELRPRL